MTDPQILALPVPVRDAVVDVLLSGHFPNRPARDAVAAVQALMNLVPAEPPEDHTLPRQQPLVRRGRPPKKSLPVQESLSEPLHRAAAERQEAKGSPEIFEKP